MVYSDWVLLKNLHIPPLSSHSAIFSLIMEADEKVFLTLNRLPLLFKYYVYVSSSPKVISFEALMKSIMKVYRLEKTLSQSDERKIKLCTEKWKTILQNLWNITKIWCAIPSTHYNPLLLFYTPEKIRKPLCLLMFSGGTEKQHQAVMGQNQLYYRYIL